MPSGPSRSLKRLFAVFPAPMLLAAVLVGASPPSAQPVLDPSQFPLSNPRGEIRLARIETGSSEFELAEPLGVDLLGGEIDLLLPQGTRLPASYEERRFVESRETEAIQLHLRGGADEPGGESRSIGLFASSQLGVAPGGLPHLTARIEVSPEGLVTVSVPSADDKRAVKVGTVRVKSIRE